jgi:hypothetical protein
LLRKAAALAEGFLSPPACLLRIFCYAKKSLRRSKRSKNALLCFFATLAFGVFAPLALLRMASEAKKAFGRA